VKNIEDSLAERHVTIGQFFIMLLFFFESLTKLRGSKNSNLTP
jgi:hypothetical protein